MAFSAREKRANKSLADRKYQLRKKYGLTLEQYESMLRRQGGRCAICHKTPRRVRLAVDHDHRHKGRAIDSVRGLLCIYCNRFVLGHARGWTPAMFRIAADYLEFPPGAFGTSEVQKVVKAIIDDLPPLPTKKILGTDLTDFES